MMKSYRTHTSIKNIMVFLIIAIAIPFIPLNAISKDITIPTTTTLLTDSRDTTTPRPNINTNTSSQPTPTTIEKGYQCPISLIFEGDQQQKTLREFRDEVLVKHKKGIIYSHLYCINSPEITLIILSNQDIKTHVQKLLLELLPVATALLKKGEAELAQQLLDDADILLNEIAHKASPQLREFLRMAKSDIIKKEIFKELGIKITQ